MPTDWTLTYPVFENFTSASSSITTTWNVPFAPVAAPEEGPLDWLRSRVKEVTSLAWVS